MGAQSNFYCIEGGRVPFTFLGNVLLHESEKYNWVLKHNQTTTVLSSMNIIDHKTRDFEIVENYEGCGPITVYFEHVLHTRCNRTTPMQHIASILLSSI